MHDFLHSGLRGQTLYASQSWMRRRQPFQSSTKYIFSGLELPDYAASHGLRAVSPVLHDPSRQILLMYWFSSTGLGEPRLATFSIARPMHSVVVTYFGKRNFHNGYRGPIIA
jgi:hypothetical protein